MNFEKREYLNGCVVLYHEDRMTIPNKKYQQHGQKMDSANFSHDAKDQPAFTS